MRKIFVILTLITFYLVGCGSKEPIEYLQMQLPMPEYMELRQADHIVTYEKGSEKFNLIYESILENWWKTATNAAEIVEDTELRDVEKLEEIKTVSDKRYLINKDVYLSFFYEKEPLQWTKSKDETVDVGEILFMFPEYPEANKNVQGYYIVYRSDQPSVHEGIYNYYFSDDTFEALSENGLSVVTNYRELPIEVDLQYFSDLTFEEVKETLITYNNWTHLEKYLLGWNPLTKQIVINHTFSEKTSEEELQNARDFWKTMHFVNRDASVWTMHLDIWNLYNNIPKDAEVIIQVFVEDKLITQDIYSDIENNIIYEITRYEKENH